MLALYRRGLITACASRHALQTPVRATSSSAVNTTKTKSKSAAAASAATSAPHKMSSNTSDASGSGATSLDEVPSYSAPQHTAYLLLHGRRLWMPVAMASAYYALSSLFLMSAAQQGLYATACVIFQRLSIHGASNKVRKDLTGHTCVVTGGTSGIGLYTAMQLLDMGAHVVIASKPGKENDTRDFLLANCRPTSEHKKATADGSAMETVAVEKRISFVSLDLNDQLDVMAAAARIKSMVNNRIDILVNAAGVWKEEPGLTKQGFEEHIGVNFLGPFHLTEALLPALRRAANRNGRVVYVTCAAHNGVRTANIVQERMLLKPSPDAEQITARCYSASKLGNIYHAQSLASRRYEGIPINKQSDLHPVDACCADPTFSATNLQRETAPFLGTNILGRTLRSLWVKDAFEGSQTVVNCCVRDTVENGGYYAECRLMPSGLSRRAQDPKCREEVVRWAMAKTIAKLYPTSPREGKK